MGRLIVDAASSLDGFWADAGGRNVLSTADLDGSGLSGRLEMACGAIVMSRRSYELPGDVGWMAEAYPPGTPVFVVSETAPAAPSGDNFRFMPDYAAAFAAAQDAAGDRPVLVVGEAGAMGAALGSGQADAIWLRVLSRTLGRGAPLFEEGAPVQNYFVAELETTPEAVHMLLERRLQA
ncbi:dihydrofolate reductase family protein [Novosphingobium panipatense]|uniref:Dihydrofolate reductase n=1 Tax=Novosphingobium panipatense TaxID=428991 RepID=A0ABY1QUE2_9SPHN|nr:riboflavin biosynthesis protein RibD [Novosphingobium panipatense]SMP78189.1 Dihydrofolate reductase [Novosphingobium panipatense]